MDVATAIKVAKAANKDSSTSDLDEPPQTIICGRAWHWSEPFFILSCAAGAALTFVSFGVDLQVPIVFAIILLVVSAIGTALVWNLATSKRLAASAKELAKTIKEMVAANAEMAQEAERLEQLGKDFGKRNAQFKESTKLLDKSVKNIAGVENQMKGLMDQQEAIVRKRQEHTRQMEALMEQQDKNAIDEAKNLLRLRVMDQFRQADADNDGKISKGAEWDAMTGLLKTNGIELTDDFDMDGDGMDDMELEAALDKLLDGHFAQLFATLKKNRELEDQIEEKKRQLRFKQAVM